MKHPISTEEFLKILDRFLKGKSAPNENNNVIRWIESVDEDENFSLSEEERKQTKDQLWASLNQRAPGRGKQVLLHKTFSPWLSRSIAASLLFLTATFVYLQLRPTKTLPSAAHSTVNASFLDEVANTGEEAKEVHLADGSTILLQPHSSLSYNDVVHGEKRLVTLKGEAFFTVAHDKKKPFIVYADHVMTTVLGTSFSINAPGNGRKISVAVITGKVSVSSFKGEAVSSAQTTKTVILLPNQKAEFDPLRYELSTGLIPEPKPVVEISKTRIVFDEEPVANILESIAKTYAVEIDYDKLKLANCKMTTAFSDEGLYERLDVVSKTMGATYTVQGTRILFESKVCN